MPSRWLFRITALIAATLLAACSGGSGFQEADAPPADETGGETAAGDGGETAGGETGAEGGQTLQLWGAASSPAEDAALQAIVDQYSEETGNTVELVFQPEYDTTLQTAFAGGQPPDVFYVGDLRLPDLAEAGVLAPAEGMIDDPDDFFPSLVEAMSYDGTWYAPPKDFSTLALEYDVAALSEAGIEPPTTWEELAAAAEALTTEDRVGLVLGAEYPRWGAFMFQNGGAVTDEEFTEMTVNSPEVTEAFEYLQGLYEQGYAATATELDAGWPGEAFGQGKAAMTIEGNWMVGFMRDTFPDVEWAAAPLPEGPAGPGTFAFTVGYGVAANAANPDASWDLVNYLVGPEAMLEYTSQFPVMPSRQSIADDWLEANEGLDPFLEGADYAHAFQFVPGFQDAVDTLNDGIQGVAAGNREIDQVLSSTEQAGQGVLGG